MNKKFSTLVASLLLMGAFGTVDAKLTKVNNPQIGESYLMGNAVNATPGTMNFAASLSVTNAKSIVKFGEAEWTLEQVLDADAKPVKGQFYLKDATGKYLNSKNNNGLATLSTKAKALTFVLKGGKVYAETDPNAKWKKGWLLGIANNSSGKPEVMAYEDTATDQFVQFAVYSVADDIEGHALMNTIGSDYYYVGQTDAAGENAKVMGQDGKMTAWNDNFATPEEVDKYLWKVEKKELSGRIFYVFTNKADDKKTYTYEAEAAYDKGFNLKELNTAATALYQSPVIQKTGEELNKIQDGTFALTIKKAEKDNSEILGLDALSGDLKAVQNGVRFQLKSGDEYVVLNKKDTWGDNIGAKQRGAKFTTVSEKELTKNAANYSSYFEFYYNVGAANASKINAIKVFDKATGAAFGQLFIQTLNENICLTTSTNIDAPETWPYITLGSSKVVKPEDLVKPKFYTVTKIEEEGNTILAATDCDAYEFNEGGCKFEKKALIGNDLEIQWALTYANDTYTFTNRENTNITYAIPANALYTTDEDNVYTCKGIKYEIATITDTKDSDGYRRLEDVKNNKFNIGFSSQVFDNVAWFIENHEGKDNHTVGLETDIDAAMIFTAKEWNASAKDNSVYDEDGELVTSIPSDSIYVISKMQEWNAAKGKFEPKADTLKVLVYSFKNQFGEGLTYSSDKFVAQKDNDGQHFALRYDNGKLNLRLAAAGYELYCQKMYAGDAANGILNLTNAYERTENDLFVVEATEKPMYRRVAALDTISIFRDENHSQLLFEDAGFLGLKNENQFDFDPTLLADAAYAPAETYRPQYLLAVGAKINDAEDGTLCEICNKPDCEHSTAATPGSIEGRYLVNLKDTAIVWHNANKHNENNPYTNSENLYRLGFVQAKHIGDSLVIASTNDSLYVAGEDFNEAKFAFRYVDQAEGSFVIETANYYTLDWGEKAGERFEYYPEGYVKWMNGVVVVVPNIDDADVFNMNDDEHRDPTANEEIATSEVTVIAGEGQLTIANAAGKKVVVSNILGQVVANTVLSSDNATIAAPQGVVVVAVEGEAAVKAIVK